MQNKLHYRREFISHLAKTISWTGSPEDGASAVGICPSPMLGVVPEVFHNITGLHKTQEALNCIPVSSFTTSSVLFY